MQDYNRGNLSIVAEVLDAYGQRIIKSSESTASFYAYVLSNHGSTLIINTSGTTQVRGCALGGGRGGGGGAAHARGGGAGVGWGGGQGGDHAGGGGAGGKAFSMAGRCPDPCTSQHVHVGPQTPAPHSMCMQVPIPLHLTACACRSPNQCWGSTPRLGDL